MRWVYIAGTRQCRACLRDVKALEVSEQVGKGRKGAMPKIFPFRRSAAPIDFGSKKPGVSV